MTTVEAFEFFHSYGNGKYSVEWLMSNQPSEFILDLAAKKVLRGSANPQKTTEAYNLIRKHFGLEEVSSF